MFKMPKHFTYFLFGKPFILRTIFVFLLSVSTILFFPLPVSLSLLFGGCFVYSFYASMEFDQKKRQVKKQYEEQFLFVFRYFQILLQQSLTSYQALKELLPFVDDPFHHQLALFLIQVDQDKSIQPYRNLAKTFDSMMVEQILLSMYQLDLQNAGGLLHHRFILTIIANGGLFSVALIPQVSLDGR